MKNKLLISILIQTIAFQAFGQNIIPLTDSVSQDKLAVSALNLRPEVLVKNELSFRLNFNFPKYFRTLNSATGHMEKLSDKVVMNEMLVNAYIDYGISNSLTIFTQVPVSDIHHYSPMGVVAGKGFADIGAGAAYRLLENKSRHTTLTGEATLFFPTGRSNHLSPSEYPLGLGIFHLKGSLTGMKRWDNSDLISSAYYEFRPENSSDLNIGDEFGLTVIRQNYYKTQYGNFGIEYGGFANFKTKDKKAGIKTSHSEDYAIDAYAGAWYEYQKNLFLQFGLPYTIYQNGSLFTKYNVLIQLAYSLKF